ncbi:keratin-associated protein 14-like [Oryctolagus cuniculus]|uniref:keratin-associated protein 14-like n=1 Tax=Oryctolagus cuniculus TaxID=9986 RepID=UPI0038792F2D
MSYNCCSGNFSSRSFGGYLRHPGSSCGSSYPSNVFYSTDLQSPNHYQLGSSLHSSCQETYCDPNSYEESCGVVSSPCHTSCYRPRTSIFCSPCQTTFARPVGFGSRGFHSFGCGSPFLGCGSHGFQSAGCGPRTFSSINYRSNFYRPTYFSSRSCQSISHQPTCGFH